MNIKDRVFVVTGAGSGLGRAVAAMVVGQGGRVVVVDVNAEAGAASVAELGAAARLAVADVTDADQAGAAFATAMREFGRLDGLVNCAGIAPGEKVVGKNGPHRLDSFARAVSINLVGTFNMIRLAADILTKGDAGEGGERGIIVNTASIAAYDGQIGQAAYAASKGGVAALTLPVARELARFGVRVVTVAPGIFATPMMTAFPQEVQDGLAASVPFPPRLGQPQEYAALVRHIIENQMLNGEVIRLDGALRMAPR